MDALKLILSKNKESLKEKIGNKRTYRSTDLYDLSSIRLLSKKEKTEVEFSNVIVSKTIGSTKENETMLNRGEVIKILRRRNEPIRCFGETDYDSYQRMKLIQLLEPKHGGLDNDFKAAMEKVDEEEAVESYRQRTTIVENNINVLEVSVKQTADNLDNRELRKMRRYLSMYCLSRESVTSVNRQFYNINTNDDEDGPADITKFKKDAKDDVLIIEMVSDYVLAYLKFILTVWGRQLNARSKTEKATYQGKRDSATYNQTVEYIKPLFRLFKNKTMSADILDSMVKIVALLLDRNYLKATEAYLELAIGNAPWPLGVTNHGIHARTAQEKIYAKNVAHVLNDEVQRKYIQAVKRLISRNQMYYPTDPIRSVNYTGRVKCF